MKKSAFIGMLFILALTSCEEVIDIDLNCSDPVLVADGLIEPGEVVSLRLNYTTDYFSEATPAYETGADIWLATSSGVNEKLVHQGEGLYTGTSIRGTVGEAYTLTLQVNDETYEGSTQMMSSNRILDVKTIETEMPGSSDVEYELEITFTNNVDEENNYLIKYFVNGATREDDYSVLSHEFFANEEVVSYNPIRILFDEGDEVEIQLFSIDEDTYTYYSQLKEIDGEGRGTSTPFNPQSNLGDNIMGYFRAWSMDSQTITIP